MPVYPAPPKKAGGLGVHLTPTIEGNIIIGPSAQYLTEHDPAVREDYACTRPVMDKLMGEACQLCGFQNCSENKDAGRLTSEEGARCVMPITDLGIAIGSAVTVAQEMRVDNRVMFSAGKAALNLGILGEDIRVAYGVPLYTGSKSIFRDRK